jgi:hypothetical protein
MPDHTTKEKAENNGRGSHGYRLSLRHGVRIPAFAGTTR